ncbi:MAG: glycosyltransferase [Anaerolineae bacterium]
MKISILGPAYPFRGGIAYHTSLLAHHLNERGEEVQFLTYTRQYPKILYGRDDKDPGSNPVGIRAEQILDSINPVSWIRTANAIVDFNPAVVYIPWWIPFWAPVWRTITAVVKRKRPQTQIVFLCHNVLPHEKHWYDVGALKMGVGQADLFIAHSPAEQKKIKHFFPHIPVVYTPHPTYKMLGSSHDDGDSKSPYFLFAGLVRYYKGVDVLIEAFAKIAKQNVSYSLIIAGEFWDDAAQYHSMVKRLNIEDRVEIIDRYLANDELAMLIEQAAAVVLPYRSTTQSGMAQLALGKGTPIISTRLDGIQTTVTQDKNGLLVEPGDKSALANALARYIDDGLEVAFRQNIQQSNPAYTWDELCRLVRTPNQ